MVIPEALQNLAHTKSPIHILLALPGALGTSVMQEPASMMQCIASTICFLYIALMMIWSYYMVCTIPPGTVMDGLSKSHPEKRLGPGSSLWWRLHYQQVVAAANLTPCNTGSPFMKDCGAVENFPATIEQDLTARYRFCKKCLPITMETALALLPPDLRLREKTNRREHFLRARQERAKQNSYNHSEDISAPQGLFDNIDDEGQAEISAWLGPEEAHQIVLPPKPERSHHCRTCKTCVLKYDHHCPWINQCVGLGNERYFILFMLWFGLGTMIFSYMGWGLAYQAFRHPKTWSSMLVHRILYLAIWAKALVMGLAVIVFAMWHLRMIARGETSVENQDNGAYIYILIEAHYARSAKKRNEVNTGDSHQTFVNMYSLGWLRNFQVFFNVGPGMAHKYYTLLLPVKIEPYSDGWHWAKRQGLNGVHGGVAPEEEFTDDEGEPAEASPVS